MEGEIDHFLYPKASKEEADAAAWVATTPQGKLSLYYFKFMDMEENDVRVKVLYTSICQSDILTVREKWGPCNYPCCAGHQIIAQVTKIGPGVKKVKVGDTVGVCPIRYSDGDCHQCQRKKENLCDNRVFLYSEGYFGGYATHIQVNQNWTFPISPKLDITSAPPILCAGVTVFAPIKRYGKPGLDCAIIGIGGLGHLAIQYAAKLGMKVTAFTTKVDQPQLYKKLGAIDVQHSVKLQELQKNEQKYDLVINTLFITDQAIFSAHQKLTGPMGVYVNLGVPEQGSKITIETGWCIRNQIKVVGSLVGSINEVQQTVDFAAQNDIKPIVQMFDFENFNQAFERAEKGPKFRCVVNVTDWAKKNGFDK